MAFNTQEDQTVTAEALVSAATGKYHIKVGWGSGSAREELDCPCSLAPCGFVQDDFAACLLHGPKAKQVPRQRHRVKDCPVKGGNP